MKLNMLKRVTVLIMPPDGLPSWKVSLTLRAILAGLAVWTILTLWAGASAMRRADYWATKADHYLMQQKLERVLEEVERSRGDMERAGEADRKLRELLGMPSKRAILEADPIPAPAGAAGGPSDADRTSLVRNLAQKRLQSFAEISKYLINARGVFRDTPLGLPAAGRFSSSYGYRVSPMRGGEDDAEFHRGIDIANEKGTPIVATADGLVERAGWAGGYGNMVMVRNEHGFSTLYGHASKLAVSRGERVKRGQILAYMGTTGRSTGNHVHYEVWRHGRPVNPSPFLKEAP